MTAQENFCKIDFRQIKATNNISNKTQRSKNS